MIFLEKTIQQQEQMEAFVLKVEQETEKLAKYLSAEEIRNIAKIKANFLSKTSDFYSEERKLNIGVMGQVKAGKSSFLNSLLFDGVDVLPRAS